MQQIVATNSEEVQEWRVDPARYLSGSLAAGRTKVRSSQPSGLIWVFCLADRGSDELVR